MSYRPVAMRGGSDRPLAGGEFAPALHARCAANPVKAGLTGAGLYRLFRPAMQLTKQQKIYAAVLGLAVSAFAFDRFILGPGDAAPDEVAAAPASARPAPRRVPAQPAVARDAAAAFAAAPAYAAPPGPAGAASNGAALSARLEAVAAARNLKLDAVGDAFRPSPVWVGSPKQIAPSGELVDAAAEFQKKRKLMAVMKQGAGGIAIIDKTYLSVGQSLDGFRLVAVKDRSAVLRRGTQRVELRLRDDEPGVGISGSSASEKIAGTDGQ